MGWLNGDGVFFYRNGITVHNYSWVKCVGQADWNSTFLGFSHSNVAVNDDSPGGKTLGFGSHLVSVMIFSQWYRFHQIIHKKRCSLSKHCINLLPIKLLSLLQQLHIKSYWTSEPHVDSYSEVVATGNALCSVCRALTCHRSSKCVYRAKQQSFSAFLTVDQSCRKYVSGSNGYRRSCLKELQVTGCNFAVKLPTPFPSIWLSGSQ